MKKLLSLIASVLCLVSFADEILFRLDIRKEALDKIAVTKKYTIQTIDKKNCLYFKGPASFVFRLPDELAQFEGEHLRITYRYRLKDVPQPAKAHLGFKVMGLYKYDGKSHNGHAACPYGTKDWTWEGYNFLIHKNARDIRMAIVLPPGGEAWISDFTVSFQNKK